MSLMEDQVNGPASPQTEEMWVYGNRLCSTFSEIKKDNGGSLGPAAKSSADKAKMQQKIQQHLKDAIKKLEITLSIIVLPFSKIPSSSE